MQHVVAIPYPAQGHINPMLQLCRQLSPLGFTFTFVITHHIHQRVQHARARTCHPSPASDAHHHVGHDIQDPYELQHSHAHDLHHELHAHDTCHSSQACVHTPNPLLTPHDGLVHHAHATDVHHIEDACAHDADDQYKGCSSIHMVFVAGGCAPEQHARNSTWSQVYEVAQEMQEPVEQLLSHILEERAVAFILSDIMLRWSSTTADKFSLPWVGFWPASAASCSALLHCSDLAAAGKDITSSAETAAAVERTVIQGIPGLPPMHLDDIPKVWDSGTGKVAHPVLRAFEALKEACCLLLNTFEELEGQVLEALCKRLPTVALGPLLPSHYILHTCPNNQQHAPLSLFPEDRTCLAWLDTQPLSSVVFISFGSISLRSEQQLQELALGLHASGCPFLWVCRPGISTGFTLDDNQDAHHLFTLDNGHRRGRIVPWAPQLQVLSHPSVGGFITHCGWNSVIESVSMGVPMLCWGDTGERKCNQRFIVDFWKCGVDMVERCNQITQHVDEPPIVGRREVEKSVRFLMLEEAGAPIRARATQLKAIAMTAFEDPKNHFKEFVQAMEQKHFYRPT